MLTGNSVLLVLLAIAAILFVFKIIKGVIRLFFITSILVLVLWFFMKA